MNHTREEVMDAAQSRFPSQPVATIIEILDLYGVEPHEGERERVQLAILKLCEGDENKLLHFVEVAKQDYRDVLYWAEYPHDAGPDGAVLDALRRTWNWVLPDPVRIVARSPFGNFVVVCADGGLWRVSPEGLRAAKIRDDSNFSAALEDKEFREDWHFEGVVAAALEHLGAPGEGQCYAFKIWPVMGGGFTPDNMYIATTTEWVAVSGDVGRQIKDLPPGTKITFDTGDAGGA